MSNIIQLLPDHVANQIAAGEVIQRPASVVKELLENAIDAEASRIHLVIKDAGKTLIQVTDNGKGMSDSDARMCFERHATSKISSADDIFKLNTKGFRGEALASIASIAHVHLKSKQLDDELGSELIIKGSIVQSQEPIGCTDGSSFAVKNLFFNVPARRNFLKSDQVETKHIIEELTRVALAHPNIEFTMHNNGDEVFYLPSGGLKQRLVGILGKHYAERLVPINEDTTIVQLSGFLIKPEHAKKSRGDQYFFVNNRFIKSPYLNHAVNRAFEELIKKDQHPGYFIFMDVDPSSLDVNIHPTKTEVKFEDEKHIYAIIQSAVRSSLGKFNITPTIDFDQEQSFNQFIDPNQEIKLPEISVNKDYNPFEADLSQPTKTKGSAFALPKVKQAGMDQWQSLYEVAESPSQTPQQEAFSEQTPLVEHKFLQLKEKYLIGSIKNGYMVIDQYRAHYRILYDKLQDQLDTQSGKSQGLIFDETIDINQSDFKHINAIEAELHAIGFRFTKEDYTLKLTAKPADLIDCDAQQMIEDVLDRFKMDLNGDKWSPKESLLRSLAKNGAVRKGRKLTGSEMNTLVDELFACNEPQYAPNGKKTIIKVEFDALQKLFD